MREKFIALSCCLVVLVMSAFAHAGQSDDAITKIINFYENHGCGASMRGGGPPIESTMETNVAGIYVAGTAVAGTQNSKYKIFLENCHDHVNKIIKHITGVELPPSGQPYRQQINAQPES